jgi:hypothetical protein
MTRRSGRFFLGRSASDASRCVRRHLHCAGGSPVLLGSALVRAAGPDSLLPFPSRGPRPGAPPSSCMGAASARPATSLPGSPDVPSSGSPATVTPSRPAAPFQIRLRDDHRHRSRRSEYRASCRSRVAVTGAASTSHGVGLSASVLWVVNLAPYWFDAPRTPFSGRRVFVSPPSTQPKSGFIRSSTRPLLRSPTA